MKPGSLISRLVCAWHGHPGWSWNRKEATCQACGTRVVIPPDLYERKPNFAIPVPARPQPRFIDPDFVRTYIGRVELRGGYYDFGKWGPTGPQRNVEDFCIIAVRVVAWEAPEGMKASDLTLRIGRTFAMNLASAPGAGAVLDKNEEGKGWVKLRFSASVSDSRPPFLLDAPSSTKLIIDVIAHIARG